MAKTAQIGSYIGAVWITRQSNEIGPYSAIGRADALIRDRPADRCCLPTSAAGRPAQATHDQIGVLDWRDIEQMRWLGGIVSREAVFEHRAIGVRADE